jgi:hypothetical protein
MVSRRGGKALAPALSLMREIDFAGNTIREMDITSLQRKAANAGYNFTPGNFTTTCSRSPMVI